MATDSTTGTALEPVRTQQRPPKVYEPVSDVIPILDTARFEHMQRIATIMAGSSLIPDSLRVAGSGDNKYELPAATVVANCFLIVNQSVRWGMDPFAVASSTSVVHGRLMYEGKLVAAVLESKLGLQLKYEFGTWNASTETLDLSKEGQGESLGVRVSGQRQGDAEPVFIEGAVSIWKTTGANSPWRPGAFKRQLRYRGAREWSRAYSSGLMLGVITDDELDVLAERRETAQRVSARSAAPALTDGSAKPSLGAGFGDETDAILKKAPEKAQEGDQASGAPAEAAKPSEPSSGQNEGKAAASDELPLGPTEDELLEARNEGAEAAGSGRAREDNPFEDGPLADAFLEGWDAKAEALAEEERAMLAEDVPELPPLGEIYMIHGEPLSDAGRRKTYRDGFSHSSVGEKGAAGLKEYRRHRTAEEMPEEEKDEARPTETDGAPSAEPKADTSGSATDAPSDSAEATSGATQSESTQQKSAPQDDDDTFPGDRDLKAAPQNPFAATHEKIVAADSWMAIKQHLRDLAATDAYREAEDEGKRMLRVWAYEAYKDLREGGKESVEPSADITLFRFWLEFDASSPDQIGSLFRSLHKSDAYANAGDADKRALGEMISRRKAALAEASA